MNRRKKTLAACVLTAAMLAVIFVAGLLLSEDTYAVDFSAKALAPCIAHPFGTDWMGRDMLARTVKGLSRSIFIGIAASVFSSVLAVFVGMTAALGSRRVDAALNWVIDLVMGVPHLVLVILISFLLGRGSKGLMAGIILTHWCSLARVIRAEVLSIRREPYVELSAKFGRSGRWILLHHIFPHVLPQILIGLILLFPHAILHESSATFLGFGLPPDEPAVGVILAESMSYLTGGMWWLAVLPGAALLAVVLLFDHLGEELKLLLDPAHAQE